MSLEGCPPLGGATLIFSWRLCGCQSAHGPRATISLRKHDRAAAPSQAPVGLSVLPLGTWDSCEGRGSLRQRAGRRGPALNPLRAPLVSSRGACATWGGGAGWGDGGQKPAGGRELRRVHLGEEASDFPLDPSCKTACEPGSAGWGWGNRVSERSRGSHKDLDEAGEAHVPHPLPGAFLRVLPGVFRLLSSSLSSTRAAGFAHGEGLRAQGRGAGPPGRVPHPRLLTSRLTPPDPLPCGVRRPQGRGRQLIQLWRG